MEKPIPPEKPKNYWLNYAVISAISLAIGLTLIYFEVTLATLYTVILVTQVPPIWFRKYNSAYAEYLRNLQEFKRANEPANGARLVSNSRVNENIRRYREIQKVKKREAQWWQFWV